MSRSFRLMAETDAALNALAHERMVKERRKVDLSEIVNEALAEWVSGRQEQVARTMTQLIFVRLRDQLADAQEAYERLAKERDEAREETKALMAQAAELARQAQEAAKRPKAEAKAPPKDFKIGKVDGAEALRLMRTPALLERLRGHVRAAGDLKAMATLVELPPIPIRVLSRIYGEDLGKILAAVEASA